MKATYVGNGDDLSEVEFHGIKFPLGEAVDVTQDLFPEFTPMGKKKVSREHMYKFVCLKLQGNSHFEVDNGNTSKDTPKSSAKAKNSK